MLRPYLNTAHHATRINISLLLLRLWVAILMIPHGYSKLVTFAEKKDQFMPFAGMDSATSLRLVILAELFCSITIGLGLLTRFSLLPPMIAMSVAVFKAHNGDVFGDGQTAVLYLGIYLALFIAGAGRYSVDHFLFHKNDNLTYKQ